jgi:large subunit ribosomal protein L2
MSTLRTNPTSPGTRHANYADFSKLTTNKPLKSLVTTKKKISGRNNTGKITIRHRGGAQKRKLRLIDFKRNKFDIPAKVTSIEYDPNRTSNIALVNYADGEKRYILAPEKLTVGATVITSDTAEIEPGNALTLAHIPIGTPIHNLEIKPGRGGQVVRGAGSSAIIQSKEGKYATVLLPSKEIRLFSLDCHATIGQVSNSELKTINLGKAGRRRHLGWRPAVRGTAQHPGAHPHGGGEGRSGIGMKAPKTPWGKKTLGKKTRKGIKYSDKYIIRDRRVK